MNGPSHTIDWDTLLKETRRSSDDSHELRFNCPCCKETRGRFYLNKNTGAYYCFNCGVRGRRQKNIFDWKTMTGTVQVSSKDFPALVPTLPYLTYGAKQYLASHHIPMESRTWWDVERLGVASGAESMSGRIVFSVKRNGKVVFRSAHSTSGEHPKALGFGRGCPWWVGWEEDEMDQLEDIQILFLVEGPADALRLYYAIRHMKNLGCNFDALPVCLFGKTIKEDELFLLAREVDPEKVVVFLDRGEHRAAQELVAKAAVAFDRVSQVFWEDIETGKDPASISEGDMSALLEEIIYAR